MAETDKAKPQKVTIKQGEITDPEYTHAEFIPDESGRYQMDMRMKHPAFVSLVNGIAEWFKESGGVNFVTLDATHPELGCLSIVVQRMAGEKTPTQRIAELEAELRPLVKSIEILTPGGSEFHNDPKRCVNWIKDRLSGPFASIKAERDQLADELKDYKDGVIELEKMNTELAAMLEIHNVARQKAEQRELAACADLDEARSSLETARKALEAIRSTYYNQQISTLRVAVTMCAFAEEALAQINPSAALEGRDRAVVKPEPGMKCGYCGERWPKPGHFDERGFCRSSREFGLEG